MKKNQQINCTLLRSIPVQNQLGEGVIWHPQQQNLWWTDIQGKLLFCYSPAQDDLKQWSVPERIGSFGFVKDRDELIVAFESGLAFYHVETQQIQWLGKPESDRTNNRFNDGRVDRHGRFWAGCMVEKVTANNPGAGLYRVGRNQQISRQLDGFHISNGLCWSPDGTVMYHADSPAQAIYRYDFEGKSEGKSCVVKNKQLFAQTPAGIYPDGSTVDAQGGIWNAQWGGHRVVRYQPDGEISFILELPVSQPSCVCFGGPDMDWLFITSARQDLSPQQLEGQPEAGNLLIYQTNIVGLDETMFG